MDTLQHHPNSKRRVDDTPNPPIGPDTSIDSYPQTPLRYPPLGEPKQNVTTEIVMNPTFYPSYSGYSPEQRPFTMQSSQPNAGTVYAYPPQRDPIRDQRSLQGRVSWPPANVPIPHAVPMPHGTPHSISYGFRQGHLHHRWVPTSVQVTYFRTPTPEAAPYSTITIPPPQITTPANPFTNPTLPGRSHSAPRERPPVPTMAQAPTVTQPPTARRVPPSMFYQACPFPQPQPKPQPKFTPRVEPLSRPGPARMLPAQAPTHLGLERTDSLEIRTVVSAGTSTGTSTPSTEYVTHKVGSRALLLGSPRTPMPLPHSTSQR